MKQEQDKNIFTGLVWGISLSLPLWIVFMKGIKSIRRSK